MKSSVIVSLMLLAAIVPPLFAASDVCRFTLPEVLEGQWDIEVILFHRDGRFHHGYALVPGRDNVPHRVDVTPSKPIRWQQADGTPLNVPDRMRGYYSYKLKEEFHDYRQRYETGQIEIAYPIPTPPVAWKDGSLSGLIDVLIAPVNLANRTGRGPHDIAWRMRLDAKGKTGGSLTGTATLWTYEDKDDDYGADADKTTVPLEAARWDSDYWRPADTSQFAAGSDWPQARGPMLTGAAVDCERPLIDNLDDAKLLWVGEEIIGGGRGAVLSRGGFAMYPYAWQNIGYGAFAGVTVADGRVFQYLTHPDEERVAADEQIASNVYVQLGADPRTMANERGHLRDTVLCLDARTGKTLWWFKSQRTFGKVSSGKGGVGMTACYYRGNVYARGSGGLYCLNAADGTLLWNKKESRKGDLKVGYGPSGGWSHDESPVIIAGVLVMGFGGEESLAGIDPKSGDLLWAHDAVKGQNAVPTQILLDNKEYIIVCGNETPKLSLINPSDGAVLWQSNALGPNQASLSVWGDIVLGNSADREQRKQGTAAAVRVSTEGAERLWAAQNAGYPPFRSLPVAHKGHFYVDDREGFFCLNAAGEQINSHPHIYDMTGGSHNWVWTITGNRRVITSGLLMFSTAQTGFERMPGRLCLDLADGYMCPIKPALADGRLFCRLSDKIVCYDLRKDPQQQSKTFHLTAAEAFAGSTRRGDPVKLRIRCAEDTLPRISASWPEVVGPEAQRIAEQWAAWYKKPLRWRTYPVRTLDISADRLHGTVRVPMGWHFEQWQLDIAAADQQLTGSFARSIPAVSKPLNVAGSVSGSAFDSQQGRCFSMTLDAAATQLNRSDQRRPVTVVVVRSQDSLRGWAVAGKVNGMAHEVDPSKLKITDNALSGSVTIIFRDDPYFHLNDKTRTAVAGTYRIRAAATDDKIQGTHTGTFGHAWTRRGRLNGYVTPQ